MATEKIHAHIKAELQEWAILFIRERQAFLQKKKIKGSGKLSREMAAEINSQVLSEVTELLLAFEDYGRILDMRRVKGAKGGGDYIKALERWIKESGREQKLIKGYLRRQKKERVPKDILNRLAWGIAIKRSKKVRHRPWWNRSKTAAITDLFNRVIAELPAIASDEIKESFR